MMKSKHKSELVAPLGAPSHLSVVPSEESAAPVKPLFEVRDLKAQGAMLPVGIMQPDGTRSRLFRLRPFKLKQEKALAKLRDEVKAQSPGTFVCNVLAMMVQTIGPHNFDAMKDGERQLVINQLTMPDVIYMYMYMRYEALGDEPVLMVINCAKCSSQYRWYGDLGSMEVKCVPDDAPKDMSRVYNLRDPIELRSKQVRALRLDMIKWDSFSRPGFNNKDSQAQMAIMASVVGAEGIDAAPGMFRLADTELDELTKYDIGGITEDIEEHTPGPQLDVEPECPHCGLKQKMMLDWSWDNFFARSARPIPTNS